MIKEMFVAVGAAIGFVAIAGTAGLVILGSACSVKSALMTERLITKVGQLEERIMRVEVMVARGDNKCSG